MRIRRAELVFLGAMSAGPLPEYRTIETVLEAGVWRQFKDAERRNSEVACRNALFPNEASSKKIWTVVGRVLETRRNRVKLRCGGWEFASEAASELSLLRVLERTFDFRPYVTSRGETYWFTFERRLERPLFVIRGYRSTGKSGMNPFRRSLNSDRTEILVDLGQDLADLQKQLEINQGRALRLKVRSPSLGTPARTSRRLQLNFKDGSLASMTLEANDGKFELLPRESEIQFERDFHFGVATAAHQIEGYTQNSDWYAFEQIPGRIFDQTTSLQGPQQWDRLDQDLVDLARLNVSTYRLSLAWDKLEPTETPLEDGCVWHTDAVAHYQKVFRFLRDNRIDPLVTLHHFVLPQWLRAKGGWESPYTRERYVHFSKCAYTYFGSDVTNWVTFNEPFIHILGGLATNRVPPAKNVGVFRLLKKLKAPLTELVQAHRDVYHAFHALAESAGRTVRLGMAYRHDYFLPEGFGFSGILSGFADSNNNWALPKAVQRGRLAVSFGILGSFRRNIENLAGTQDFYGMNYYSRIAVRSDGSYGGRRELQHVDEMNWENFPQGLYSFLKAAHALSPNVPIWITENGVADGLDIDRERYIRQHLQAVAEAQREGVPVERYYYWSWIDNWEWEQGLRPRFGLVDIDYATGVRTFRPSAYWFSNLARTRLLDLGR